LLSVIQCRFFPKRKDHSEENYHQEGERGRKRELVSILVRERNILEQYRHSQWGNEIKEEIEVKREKRERMRNGSEKLEEERERESRPKEFSVLRAFCFYRNKNPNISTDTKIGERSRGEEEGGNQTHMCTKVPKTTRAQAMCSPSPIASSVGVINTRI